MVAKNWDPAISCWYLFFGRIEYTRTFWWMIFCQKHSFSTLLSDKTLLSINFSQAEFSRLSHRGEEEVKLTKFSQKWLSVRWGGCDYDDDYDDDDDDNMMMMVMIMMILLMMMRTQVRRVRGEERRGREELWAQIRSLPSSHWELWWWQLWELWWGWELWCWELWW